MFTAKHMTIFLLRKRHIRQACSKQLKKAPSIDGVQNTEQAAFLDGNCSLVQRQAKRRFCPIQFRVQPSSKGWRGIGGKDPKVLTGENDELCDE